VVDNPTQTVLSLVVSPRTSPAPFIAASLPTGMQSAYTMLGLH